MPEFLYRIIIFFVFTFLFFTVSTPLQVYSTNAVEPEYDQEVIESYESFIKINQDGSLLVTEAIIVYALNLEILHGIYRDYPTDYKTDWGFTRKVGFEIVDIEKEGKEVIWRIKQLANGKRVYIGDPSQYISKGSHTYTITYKTDHQIGYYKDYFELYYNITGNGWSFPINSGKATIQLPEGVEKNEVNVEGYTGLQNEKGREYTTSVTSQESKTFAHIKTTNKLEKFEGLTVVVTWPKDYTSNSQTIEAPNTIESLTKLLKDNISFTIALFTIFLLAVYYFIIWLAVGRDPGKSTTIPLFSPPYNMSPASIRFLNRMKFDNKCITSAIVHMGVKGYLQISEENDVFFITRKKNNATLSHDEQKLADNLFSKVNTLVFTSNQSDVVKKSIMNFKSILELRHLGKTFKKHSKFLIPGIILTVLSFLSVLIYEIITNPQRGEIIGIALILVAFSFVTPIILEYYLFLTWKNFFYRKTFENLLVLFIGTFVSLIPVVFDLVTFVSLGMIISFPAVILLFIVVLVSIFAEKSLKSRTREGRVLQDKINGFKMFLAATEEKRIKLLHQKLPKTLQTYEKYLPYAIALDIEGKWTQNFEDEISKATKADPNYTPAWYTGTGLSFSAASFGSSLANSINTSITSTSNPPGLSSGAGGAGGSGGGGGGGGGGGW